MLNFIVHLGSGKGRGGKSLKKLLAYCYKNKLDFTVHITASVGHATRIAEALCQHQSSTIIAVGGDGTFHEVINGITTPEITTVGFIPSGRGNDFAKGCGIPLNPIKALKKILENKVMPLDYIDVSGKRCLNICGTGLDVMVLQRVAGKRGKITYIKSLLYCLFHFEPYTVSFVKDGETKRYSCIMIGVCNGRQFGGGIKMCPVADPHDGLLDIVIMQLPENGKIMPLIPKFLSGKHMNLPITTHFKAEEISITRETPCPIQLDGEIYEDIDFNCKIVKGGLKTFSMQ